MLLPSGCIWRNVILLGQLDLRCIIERPTLYQCVRWRRKPRWLPVAKSKMFRVPERYKTPEDELIELQRLQNNYNTQVKSIRGYLLEQVAKTAANEETSVDKTTEEEEEFARCLKINAEWNAEVAKIREQRLVKEAENRKELVLQRLGEKEEEEKKMLEEIERVVREEKERAKLYITSENIDEAIERALAIEVDYNFAIDLDGNIYHGRFTKPSDVTAQEKSQAAT